MSEPAIRARRIAKYFGDFPALREVDLDVRAGSVLALLGRNGAGKTTLLRILAGLSTPSSGTVSFPAADSSDRIQHGRIGVVGHGAWIYDELTAAENLRFFGGLYGVSNPGRVVAEWLARVGLERFANSRAAEFSRGMRQRLTIARAFLHEPNILLLDEPWTALDDRATQLLSALLDQARREGRAAVICSHQLREAFDVADQVALLHRGRLAFRGEIDASLRERPQSLYERLP